MKNETAEFKCEGTWKSKVNGTDDGIFDLKVDTATGNITGDHILSDQTTIITVKGKCKHSPDHHIEIKETEKRPDGKKFRYHGRIVPKADGEHETDGGKRSEEAEAESERESRGSLTDDDETWTGVRTT